MALRERGLHVHWVAADADAKWAPKASNSSCRPWNWHASIVQLGVCAFRIEEQRHRSSRQQVAQGHLRAGVDCGGEVGDGLAG
jgi:hypothetical protein